LAALALLVASCGYLASPATAGASAPRWSAANLSARGRSAGAGHGQLSVVAGVYVAPRTQATGTYISPTDVAVDAHGDLFIADSMNNVVEKVTPAGRLSVVAGNGKQGAPTPGPANRSHLNYPAGVAVDAHGDLFIADEFNHVVEEVTPAGRLSVVAGNGKQGAPTPGPANSSRFGRPNGVAVDAHGNLFIADESNHVVEEVTPAGRLSVVAGDGIAGSPTPGPATSSALNGPVGVAVDAHGDLFIADAGNHVVEEVTPAGRLSVVAGDGIAGSPTPGPATSSALNGPVGVAVDAHGDLFIADAGNNVVEEVTPAGRLSVVAGNGKQGTPISGPATSSALNGPVGVAVDAHGDLFIADYYYNITGYYYDNVVEEVTPAGRLSVVAGAVPDPGSPKPGPATRSHLNGPSGVAVDAHGDLFIADELKHVAEEVTPAGRLSVVAGNGKQGPPTPGPANSSALGLPSGVAVDAHGDLFIADAGNNVVEKVTPAGRLSVVAGDVAKLGPPTPGPANSSALDGPLGIAVDAHGDLFIADAGNNVVEKVTPARRLSVVAGNGKQGAPTPGPATRSPLYQPHGVAVDAHGDLFIADAGNNLVEEVTPAGRLSVVAGDGIAGLPTPGPAARSHLGGPSGVAVDAHGDLFIADYFSSLVEEVAR
jgi:sugar lactone lactonase YvrE